MYPEFKQETKGSPTQTKSTINEVSPKDHTDFEPEIANISKNTKTNTYPNAYIYERQRIHFRRERQ